MPSSKPPPARKGTPIAIIGYAYRVPGGPETDEEVWKFLQERGVVQCSMDERYGKGFTPYSRFAGEKNKNNPVMVGSPYEGYIQNGRELEFDCTLFGIGPSEAKRMDPNHKMLLTLSWEALQMAGIDHTKLHGSNTAVFCGMQVPAAASWRAPNGSEQPDVSGKSANMMANRLSFYYGLKGASLAMDTACSSGVTATNYAVRSLQDDESDMVLLGASTYLANLHESIGFNSLGVLSHTGSSRSFDKDANGYMRAEGSFLYVLKRLADAERDGDPIFGVIRGANLNAAGPEPDADLLTQGRMIVAPVEAAQHELMQQVMREARVHPSTVDYVEAHATGTKVGDRMEGRAIARAYGSSSRTNVLRIASSRSNFGHMECASFGVSLLKVLLMMKYRQFAPISSHFKSINPEIPFGEKCIQVQTTCEPFPDDHAVRVGINSFGFGGSNGHVIVEEYREGGMWSTSADRQGKAYMIPLTAKSEDSLIEYAQRLADSLEGLANDEVDFYTLAANLSRRLTHFRQRVSFAATDYVGFKEELLGFVQRAEDEKERKKEISLADDLTGKRKVVMVFPGQGSQWAGCGKELYETEPVFRRVVDAIDCEWEKLSGSKLSTLAFDDNIGDDLNKCVNAQPVTFMIQAALFELYKDHGVHPSAVVGHSAGEAAAAYASGAYSLEEACKLVYHRALLQETLAGSGRMLVLQMSSDDVEAFLQKKEIIYGSDDADIHFACFNSPTNTVVCGSAEKVAALQKAFKSDEMDEGKLIPGNIAFHSPFMAPIREDLASALASLEVEGGRKPPIPFVSTVTGTVEPSLDNGYWYSNVREPVNFLSAIRNIQKNIDPDVFVEISPHITLRSPSRSIFMDLEVSPTYIPTLIRKVDSALAFAKALGSCFKAGMILKYENIFPRPRPITHLLPPYAMKMKRMIDDGLDDKFFVQRYAQQFGTSLGERVQSDHDQYTVSISQRIAPMYKSHAIQGAAILPAACYVNMAWEALDGHPMMMDANVLQPAGVTDDVINLSTDVRPSLVAKDTFDLKITSNAAFANPDSSLTHVMATLNKLDSTAFFEIHRPKEVRLSLSDFDEIEWVNRFSSAEQVYDNMNAKLGHTYQYGPEFQLVDRVQYALLATHGLMRSSVTCDPNDFNMWQTQSNFKFHPAFLDACLHNAIFGLMEVSDIGAIPQRFKIFLLKSPPSNELEVIGYVSNNTDEFGQLASGLGEEDDGWMGIYDRPSGELIAYFTSRISFRNNNNKANALKTKHAVAWQTKGYLDETITTPAVKSLQSGQSCYDVAQQLINAIAKTGKSNRSSDFLLNVGEYCMSSSDESSSSYLESHLKDMHGRPVQFTTISADTDFLTKCFQSYGVRSTDVSLRFAEAQEDYRESEGLLRCGMFELLLMKYAKPSDESSDEDAGSTNAVPAAMLKSSLQLVAPGGLLLLESSCGPVELPAAWDILCQSEAEGKWVGLFQTPTALPLYASSTQMIPTSSAVDTAEEHCHMMVEDDMGFSAQWRELCPTATVVNEMTVDVSATSPVDEEEKKSEEPTGTSMFVNADQWKRVDYFAMNKSSLASGKLHEPSTQLTEFVKRLIAMRSTGTEEPCVFTVFTSGAMARVTDPSQTAVWGAVRSLALEVGDVNKIDFRVIDLASSKDLEMARLVEPFREQELCIHDGTVLTSRMINIPQENFTSDLGSSVAWPYHLYTDSSGSLSDIHYRCRKLPPLGDNEVEVAVKASALNFRDLMVGMARLPLLSYERSALGKTVGMECAGEVIRMGKNVTWHKLGDKVIISQGGCIANIVHSDERAALPLPHNMTFQQGASVLSVYGTAYHALYNLARLREGDSILIHSGMGGVGQAAIALAKHYGAVIYATAGSEEKRDALRAMGCVDAFDSHSTSWYSDLMKATSDRGVDCVLNSLAGPHVDLCLEALAAGGCHCEIGKVDIFADRPMKMCVFRKNIRYCAIDIDRLTMDDPMKVIMNSKAVLEMLRDEIVPPIPTIDFPYSEYQAAFRMMMNGKHQGKIVLLPPEPSQKLDVVDTRPLLRDAGTVVMTGCLGGFGLRVLGYVVAMGAKNIVLMDRDKSRRRTSRWAWDQIRLQPEGRQLKIVYGNASVKSDVDRVFADIEKSDLPPVTAIYHLAGILDDKLVADIDEESFAKVFAPKANGAWYLHEASLKYKELTQFVMVSSTSAAFGNAGQTNYSAANSFQDGLAQMRQQCGLPGLAFAMAGVVECGMASNDTRLLKMMKANGLPAISATSAIVTLDFGIRNGLSNPLATVSDNLRMAAGSNDYLRIWGQLVSNQGGFSVGREGGAMTKESLVEMIAAKVGELCNVEEIDPVEPLSSYGLNSMSVSELIVFLRNDLNFTASPMQLMTNATCEKLADSILSAGEAASDDADTTDSEDVSHHDASQGATQEDNWIVDATAFSRSRYASKMEEYSLGSARLYPAVVDEGAGEEVSFDLSFEDDDDNCVAASTRSASNDVVSQLPPVCRNTIAEFENFIDALPVPLEPAVPVEEIRCIFLTGATGLVGRHFIADLLEFSSQIERIYCPVRASSDEAALNRVKAVMQGIDKWSDMCERKLCIFAGDLHQADFGARPELYEEMSQRVDSVYHFAANLTLSATFASMKKDNCDTLRSVLTLCCSRKTKHLFYASTLGVFPQYTCNFSNEMKDMEVGRDSYPDVSLVKKHFPLGLSGYYWTKYLNEIIIEMFADAKDIPLGIFRLPMVSTNSTTGYTVTNDVLFSIYLASIQTKFSLGLRQALQLEDGKVLNDLMLQISLNPKRSNRIYNCSWMSTAVPSEVDATILQGYDTKNASYEELKAASLSLGKKSPLNGFWLLLDHFQKYWFNPKECAVVPPIDVSTLVEDCMVVPSATYLGSVATLQKTWIGANPDRLPYSYDILIPPATSTDLVMRTANELCAKYDMDVAEVVPPYVLDGLKCLVADLEVPEAGRASCTLILSVILESRVQFRRVLLEHPEIMDEEVEDPIFVFGMNRIGTSMLVELLENNGLASAPHLDETRCIPPVEQLDNPDDDFWKARAAGLTTSAQISSNLEGIPQTSESTSEDNFASAHSFSSVDLSFIFNAPKHLQWAQGHPHAAQVYEEHKEWMKMITWWRRKQGKPIGRWCFSGFDHAFHLPSLVETYPEAKFIMLHHSPSPDVASTLRLYEGLDKDVIPREATAFRQEVVGMLEAMTKQVVQFRDERVHDEPRWLDIRSQDAIDTTYFVLAKVAHHCGIVSSADGKGNPTSRLQQSSVESVEHVRLLRKYVVDMDDSPQAFDEVNGNAVFEAYAKKFPQMLGENIADDDHIPDMPSV